MGHRASAMLADCRLTPAAVAAIRVLLEPGEDLADISTWADGQREVPGTGSWHSWVKNGCSPPLFPLFRRSERPQFPPNQAWTANRCKRGRVFSG